MHEHRPEPTLSRLQTGAGAVGIADLTAALQREAQALAETLGRPHVALNMVSSLDGRATIESRSGGLSSTADRRLFHGLRSVADAVLVGAGTARTERYGRMIGDARVREERERAGRPAEPYACIVSSSLALDPALPLLSEPEAQVVILTPSRGSLPPVRATVQYVRAATADGQLDLERALRELGTRLGVRGVLCEGGPSLNAQLLRAGAVDELFLSLAPIVAGGAEPLRIVAADAQLRPLPLSLADAFVADSHLFLRYRTGAADALT